MRGVLSLGERGRMEISRRNISLRMHRIKKRRPPYEVKFLILVALARFQGGFINNHLSNYPYLRSNYSIMVGPITACIVTCLRAIPWL